MAVKRGGLGKGLDSLIPDHKTVKTTEKKKPEVEEKKEGEQLVNINKVEQTMSSQEDILKKIHYWNLLIPSNNLESYNL